MEFKDYKIADIRNKAEIADRLTKVENEISKDVGHDIILIAYQKDDTIKY